MTFLPEAKTTFTALVEQREQVKTVKPSVLSPLVIMKISEMSSTMNRSKLLKKKFQKTFDRSKFLFNMVIAPNQVVIVEVVDSAIVVVVLSELDEAKVRAPVAEDSAVVQAMDREVVEVEEVPAVVKEVENVEASAEIAVGARAIVLVLRMHDADLVRKIYIKSTMRTPS